jgi:hypothetical protein
VYIQILESFMGCFELFESILARIGFTIGEILENHLVEDYAILNGIVRYFEEVEFISPAEVVITQHVLLVVALHFIGVKLNYYTQM